MNETSNVVRGILHPDGTLELAERPTLPAGDVEVTIRPVTGPVGDKARAETLWEVMERSRAELEASGHRFRTTEEIDADIAEMRDWGDDEIEATPPPAEGYGPYLARTRARREADGFPFRTKAEIDAEVNDLRSWDDGQGEILP
jgi:hypothetical protein